MSKSHYFVQKPPEEQISSNFKECVICGKPFKPYSIRSCTCSPECGKERQRNLKAKWEKDHLKERVARHKEQARERGMMDDRIYKKLRKAKKYRKRVIKQELIRLELMTFQMISPHRDKFKIDYRHKRKGYNQEKADFIKDNLESLGLYDEQIEKSDKYHLDWSREYRGFKGLIKYMPEEILEELKST